MKLWVDDLRNPPDESWTIARSSDEAMLHLLMRAWDVMSLDHDLGGDDTTRAVVLWLCEHEPDCWPREVRVHTANPVGREWLLGMDRAVPAAAGLALERLPVTPTPTTAAPGP